MSTGKMKNCLFLLGMLSAGLSVLDGCSKDQAMEPETESPEGGVTAENVTYANFISGLVQTKCASCHAQGGGGSTFWTFSGYSSVKNNAPAIDNAVLVTGSMPLGGSLTVNEKALLKAWFDRGMPE